MKFTRVLWLIIITSSVVFPQAEFEFSGYFSEMPVYQNLDKQLAENYGIKRDIYMNLSRVRLRPVIYFFEDTRVNLEYEAALLAFNSTGSFDIGNAGKTDRQIVNLSATPVKEEHYRLNHFIDRLYIRQSFAFGNLIVGRQRIQWGSGRVWNPTDLFNPINPANFFKIEKDGADAVSFNYYLGSFTDLNLVYNPTGKIGEGNFGARFRTNYSEYDIAFISGYFDKRFVGGLDIAGNFYGAGVRFEGIFSGKSESRESYTRFIAGIDNQFSSKLYLMMEYQFNGEGELHPESYDISSLSTGKIINLSRNYLNLGLNYQYNPLLVLGCSLLKNINDGSGFLGLKANYDLISNLTLVAGGQISFGDLNSEYNLYGSSYYIQTNYFF